ncbi:MAG: hypothetical protein WBC73_20535 [Phormidesmis sp.]
MRIVTKSKYLLVYRGKSLDEHSVLRFDDISFLGLSGAIAK